MKNIMIFDQTKMNMLGEACGYTFIEKGCEGGFFRKMLFSSPRQTKTIIIYPVVNSTLSTMTKIKTPLSSEVLTLVEMAGYPFAALTCLEISILLINSHLKSLLRNATGISHPLGAVPE